MGWVWADGGDTPPTHAQKPQKSGFVGRHVTLIFESMGVPILKEGWKKQMRTTGSAEAA